jgi:hypothetical protein
MNSQEIGKYITATDGVSKPWLLLQLRLQKLQERKATISGDEYIKELGEIHQDLMNLGEWWVGIEEEVFGK